MPVTCEDRRRARVSRRATEHGSAAVEQLDGCERMELVQRRERTLGEAVEPGAQRAVVLVIAITGVDAEPRRVRAGALDGPLVTEEREQARIGRALAPECEAELETLLVVARIVAEALLVAGDRERP